MASAPNRRRMSSMAAVASSHGTSGSSSIEAQLLGVAPRSAGCADAEQPHARPQVDACEQLRGGLGDGRAGVDGWAAWTDRVMVRKSWKRTLRVTVPRPPGRRARSRDATASARRTSSGSRVSRSWWSWAKVSSWPIDLSALVGLDGAGRRCRWRAGGGGGRWPGPSARDEGVARAGPRGRRRSRTPSRCSRSRVAGPTPHSACTGSGWRKASSSPGGDDHDTRAGLDARAAPARGLAASEASLARNFVGATPTEHVSRSSLEHPGRIGGAISAPSPCEAAGAGDVEERLVEGDGSTSGVNDRKIAITRSLTSP